MLFDLILFMCFFYIFNRISVHTKTGMLTVSGRKNSRKHLN